MSLHLAISGNRRLIFASDSRGVREVSGGCDYNLRKLFPAGANMVCGITGASKLGPDDHISKRMDEICSRPSLQNSPRPLLEAIGNEIGSRLQRLYEHREVPDYPGIFRATVIRRTSEGATDFLEFEISITTDADGRRQLGEPVLRVMMESARQMFIWTSGRSDRYVPKLMAQRLDWDRISDGEVLNGIDKFYEFERSQDDFVSGGEVDVCVIDSSGFRWLRKKPDPPAVVPSVEQTTQPVKRFFWPFVVALGLIGGLGVFQVGLTIWRWLRWIG